VSPRSERQADAVAFFSFERHVVYEVTNDEQPAPYSRSRLSGCVGSGNPAGVEAVAVVVHVNADEVATQLDVDSHHAIGIFAAAIANRVPEGFGQRGAEIES